MIFLPICSSFRRCLDNFCVFDCRRFFGRHFGLFCDEVEDYFQTIFVSLYEFLKFFSVNEALDDILADSDDEEEEQAIVNQVLDEIGIEITNKVIIFGTLYKLLRIFKMLYKQLGRV